MADVKISGLPASTTPLAGTEVLPVVQGGQTRQVSVANLTAGRSVTGSSFIPSSSTIPTNGVYLPAANAVGIATASTNALYINATQQVAIGTATPFSAEAKLTVTGGGIFGDYIAPTASAVPTNGLYTPSANVLAIATNSANAITINSSQQVGIGVSPAHRFQVQSAGTGAIVSLARFGVTGNGGTGRGTGILFGASGSNNSVDVAQISGLQNATAATATSAALTFQVANSSAVLTEVARFDNVGNQTLSTGNLVIGTSGKGIDFSATPGTGTSELLNDYEEGTWTPTVFDAATGGNQGTIGGTAAGEYTKVGNLVTIHCVLININTTGMTAGNVFYIGGLPFAAKNTTSIDFHGVTDSRNITTTSGGVIASWLQDSASRARLFTTTSAGGVTGVLVSNVTSTTATIFLSLTYLAA